MTFQFHFEILECPYLQDPVATAKGVSKTSSVAAFQRWAGSLVRSSEKNTRNQHHVSKCPKVMTPHWSSSLHAPWPSEGTCVSSMEFQASDARVQTQTQVDIDFGQNSQLALLQFHLRYVPSVTPIAQNVVLNVYSMLLMYTHVIHPKYRALQSLLRHLLVAITRPQPFKRHLPMWPPLNSLCTLCTVTVHHCATLGRLHPGLQREGQTRSTSTPQCRSLPRLCRTAQNCAELCTTQVGEWFEWRICMTWVTWVHETSRLLTAMCRAFWSRWHCHFDLGIRSHWQHRNLRPNSGEMQIAGLLGSCSLGLSGQGTMKGRCVESLHRESEHLRPFLW